MKTKNKLVAIAMLLMLFVIVMPAMVENASASSGLGGIWHFDEGTGTTAYDSSGNGNHGTVHGAIWTDGKIGKALEFDGVNDYVNVPDSNSLDITGKITLEAWIYPYTVTTMQVIVQKYNYSGPPYNGAYYLGVGGYGYNNKILFGLSHNGYNFYYILSNTNIAANTWTHVAATSNGTHMIIYINGIKDKVATYSPGVIYASAAPLRIGCFLPELGVSRFFDGVIDEVRVSSGTIWTVDDDRVQCPNADFTSIQAAVNIANPDDTIIVHDGTYNENLVVNKALTIKAASKPIIDGGATGDCISVSVNNVFISGFEIRNGYNGISGQTSGSTFSNNIIHDNLNIPGSAGVGILLWGDNDNNIITGNEIYNNDRQGIFIGYEDDSKISTGNVIENDVIYDNGLYRYANGPDASAYGIQLWCADYNLIKNNEIYLHDDWFAYPEFDFAQGIYLCDTNGNTVVGNYLHDNNYGVGLWHPARSIGNNYINYNNIAGNTGYAVCTFDGLPAVDGRFNWWGDASGPTHSSNTGGTGDSISDNVDYSPWLGATFATTPRTYHVNPTGTIQEAIDEASPDDTIIVHEGTYYENLVVPKSLTIQGVDKETVVLQAQPVGYGDKAIEILASDVTISGFTISGYAATETKPGSTYWGAYAYGSSSSRYSNIVVANCIFTFLSQSGIQLGYVDGSLIADNIFKRETRLVWYDPPGPTPGSYIEVTRGGAGPALWFCTKVTIDPNVIQTTGVGIFLYSSSDILIEANTISAPDMVNPSDIGIHVQSCTNIDIIGNTILNFTAGPKSGYTYGTTGAGINILASKAINVSLSNLRNNTVGVVVQRLDLTTEPREIDIHYNNLEHNTEFGVLNCYTWIGKDKTYTPTNASYVVNATHNWWGHETGPYHGSSWEYMGEPYGPHYGLGDNVSDYVLYYPWLRELSGPPVEPPTASFNYSPSVPKVGETVTFDASSSTPNGGTIIEYQWNFDDGNTTTTSNPIISHIYASPSTYTITLTVTDNEGLSDSTWHIVTVVPAIVYVHDVAVTNVTVSVNIAYQGRIVDVNVSVANVGNATETFNVTLYYDSNIIATQNVVGLVPNATLTLSFAWNTTNVPRCHNYTIKAVASTVLGETNTDNNTFIDGWVKVTIMGDMNGDGKVDISDLVMAVNAIPSIPGWPNWNPNADLNNDNRVDIADLVQVIAYCGQAC